MIDDDIRALVHRYLEASLSGGGTALRACLADEVCLDWGTATYTDPDAFVRAADTGLEWADLDVLHTITVPGRAVVVYEATNRTDGLRIRTTEVLDVSGDVITASTVTFAIVGPA